VVLALAHEVEVGVVELGWIVVYWGEWDVWGFEVGFGPCGVVGEEVDVGGVEVGEELLEGVLVVVEGEGAVGLVGVGGVCEVSAAYVEGDAVGGVLNFLCDFQVLGVEWVFEGEVVTEGFCDVLEIFGGLPVSVEVGGGAELEELGLEAEVGFADDASFVEGANFVEECVEEGDGVFFAVDVEALFVFFGGDLGGDVEGGEAVFA